MGTVPITTEGDNPHPEKPAGPKITYAGCKPKSHAAAFPRSFPFPPPCPGAGEESRDSGATPPPCGVAPSTPRRNKSVVEHMDPGTMTPPKRARPLPTEGHLHGWEHTHIPPWLKDVPVHLRRKLVWSHSYNTHIPDDAIILLFVGARDGESLDEILANRHPHLKGRVFAIDLKGTRDSMTSLARNHTTPSAQQQRKEDSTWWVAAQCVEHCQF